MHTFRRKRPREDSSKGRPFSGMHKHYMLLHGDSWARTGSRFRPKKLSRCLELTAAEEGAPPGAAWSFEPLPEDGLGSLRWPEENLCLQCGRPCKKEDLGNARECVDCGCKESTLTLDDRS